MIWHLALWVSYASLAVLTLWSYWLAPDSANVTYWQAAPYTLAPLGAVIAGMLTVKEYGLRSAAGRIFCIITLGIGGWFIGELIWTYFDLVAQIDPFPSIADLFYLLAYIPLSVGLVWQYYFLRQTIRKPLAYTQRLLLAIIALLFGGITIYFGVYKAIQPDYSVLENVVAISYGLCDVALVLVGLVITVVTLEMRGGKFSGAWGWLLFGIFLALLADIGFAMFTPEYESGVGFSRPILDTIWIASYMTMGYGLGRFGWLVRALHTRIHAEAQQQTVSVVSKAKTPAKKSKKKK